MIIVRIGVQEGDLANINVAKVELKKLQELVGGYIEACAPAELRARGIEILCNEEGLLSGLDPNENLYPFFIVGQAVAVGVEGEDFVGLDAKQQRYIGKWLGALRRERKL